MHRYDLLKQSAAPTSDIMQHLKVLGGNLPRRDMNTWKPEHKEAEKRRFLNMEREAAPDDPARRNRNVQRRCRCMGCFL
ncbi:hypothetical protein WJX77_003730 [Trebouxia sp. C0004]